MNAACPVSFSIVTDGMGIDDEIVSYLNMNNIGVVLSWDGRNSAKTTGFDIMDMNWNVLKNINFLYLQGVLSKYALPKDWCDDAALYFNEWKDLHQRDLFLNMEHANRYGRNNEMFKGIDFRELRKQIIWLMDHMAVATDDAYTCLYKNLFNEVAITKGSNGIDCRCGNGLLVQTIDLAGNLYFCKEANTPMIRTDESVSDIVKKSILSDSTSRSFPTLCKNCEVRDICRAGCPLLNDKEKKNTFCKVEKAVFGPIVRRAKNQKIRQEKE